MHPKDYLFPILRSYISGQNDYKNIQITEKIWEDVFSMATANKLDGLLYNAVLEWDDSQRPQKMLNEYKSYIVSKLIGQIQRNEILKQVLELFKENNIFVVVLKGILLAQLYPHPEARYTSDADLYIRTEDLEKVDSLLELNGFIHYPEKDEPHVFCYRSEEVPSVFLEIHIRILELFYTKHYAVINEMRIDDIDDTITMNINGIEIASLNHTNALIYLICHMSKHYITLGTNARQFTDITLYINKYYDLIDWDKVQRFIKGIYLGKFLYTFLSICYSEFGMTPCLGIDMDEYTKEAELLVYSILDMHRGANNSVLRRAYYNHKTNFISKDIKLLKKRYRYFAECPILLPIAWFHRCIDYLRRKIKNYNIISFSERKDLTQEKLDILKKLDII